MKVFVSGAAGFLGKAVVAELAKRGHEVVGLVHNEAKGKIVEGLGGRYVIGDLLNEGPWMDEVKDSYRVLSLSLPVKFKDRANLDTMVECNVKHAKSVTNLIRAAKHGEARSIIVTYDTMCFGDKADSWVEEPGSLKPAGFCRPIGNSYDDITRAGKDAGIPLVNVFPGRVYGTDGWFAYMLERIQKGTWGLAGDGGNFMSVIHIDDLAAAYGEIVERLTHNESLALADGNPCTQKAFTEYLAGALGLPAPKAMDYHEFAEKEGIMLAESLATSVMVSSAKAVKLLDFAPVYHDYKKGIVAVMKAMGIQPLTSFTVKAA